MKYVLFVFFLGVAMPVMAQNDSLQKKYSTFQPLIILSKSQISNLPASNFMELVNQGFAFVSGRPIKEEDYSFEVNGYITINPNSINIGQIENITFYPAGTSRTRTSLTKNGTFVIQTSVPDVRNRLSLSTKTGMELPNDKYALTTPSSNRYVIESDPALFSLSEAIYFTKLRKFSLSSAYSFLRNAIPSSLATRTGDTSYADGKNRRHRFSNFLGYRFNESVSINAGLFFTNHDRDNYLKQSNTDFQPYFNVFNSATRTNYYGATLGMTALLFKKIKNEFRAEGNQTREKGATIGDLIFSGTYQLFQSATENRIYNYSLSDHIHWEKKLSPAIQLKTSTLLRYRIYKYKNIGASSIRDQNGFPVQASSQLSTIESKGFAASPEVGLRIKNVLFIKGGITYDDYKISTYNTENVKGKFYPFAGVKLDAKSLLKTDRLTELFVSSDYSRYITSLETIYSYNLYNPSVFMPVMVPMAEYPDLVSTRWISTFGAGFLNKRMSVQVNYLWEERIALFHVPVPVPPNGTIYMLAFNPIKRKGWSFELTSTVIESGKNRWNLRGVLFNEKFTAENSMGQPPTYPFDGNHIFGTDKPNWKGSLSTDAALGPVYFQVSALLSFNEPTYNGMNANYDYDQNHGLNFLLLGYKFPLKSSELKSFDVNIQTRNLFLPEKSTSAFYRYRYVGIGIRAEL